MQLYSTIFGLSKLKLNYQRVKYHLYLQYPETTFSYFVLPINPVSPLSLIFYYGLTRYV